MYSFVTSFQSLLTRNSNIEYNSKPPKNRCKKATSFPRTKRVTKPHFLRLFFATLTIVSAMLWNYNMKFHSRRKFTSVWNVNGKTSFRALVKQSAKARRGVISVQVDKRKNLKAINKLWKIFGKRETKNFTCCSVFYRKYCVTINN